MEQHLSSAGSLWKLHVLQILKFSKLSTRLHDSELSRHQLQKYFGDPPVSLSPDLYGEVCSSLGRCYATLGDYDSAVKFAEPEMESDVAKLLKPQKVQRGRFMGHVTAKANHSIRGPSVRG